MFFSRVLLLCTLLCLLPIPGLARDIPFARPVPGPIIRPIAQPEAPWTPGHRGVDLFAHPGDPILAIRDGTVRFSGYVGQVGWISLDHGGGLQTTYGPVAIPTRVRIGQRVRAGQTIAHLDRDGTHVDLGARIPHPRWPGKYAYIDPLALYTPWQIRLKTP